ncbi:MAG: hypothetical protein ABFR32_00695 [Bacteroidota bacterium]
MKKYIVHIRFIALLFLVAFLYGFAAKRNYQKKIDKIEIEFNNGKNLFITYETVNKLLIQNFDNDKNQRIDSLHLNNLEKFVKSNVMIQNAEIYATIDNKLGAIITQRTPILRVVNGSESYYFDEFGKKMPLSNNYSARVPIVTGKINENNNIEIISLANNIKKDNFLIKQIIGVDQIEKEGINQFNLRTRVGDQIIIFGTVQNFNTKRNKLKAFYQKALTDSTLQKFDTINLKFKNQVVCTKK